MNSRWLAFYEKVRTDIAAQGQSIVGVFRSPSDPPEVLPFTYTIGNHQRGLPELLWIGGADEDFGAMLNVLGERMRERNRGFSREGEAASFGGKCPVWVRAVRKIATARENYTIQASNYYRTDDYQVAQVISPDPKSRFPWDPGCAKPFRDIPLL